MKISFMDIINLELDGKDLKYILEKIKPIFEKISNVINTKLPRKLSIGIQLDNGFIYQSAKIKISQKQLAEELKTINDKIFSSYLLRFRRPYIDELFDNKYILEISEENYANIDCDLILTI